VSQSEEQKAKAFETALNRQGFAFQYAVGQSAWRLARIGFSNWVPFVAEFPVRVQGADTRIDLILKHRTKPRFLVVETKSANWALAYWCFAKSGSTGFAPVIYSEILRKVRGQFFSEVRHLHGSDVIFDVAVEASTGEKGDARGSSRGAIEDAVGQVCRGLNGLIDYFRDNSHGDEERFEFFPVVVTTAELLTTSKPLTGSDLKTGTVALEGDVQSRSWVFLRYPQSPGLKHSVSLLVSRTLRLSRCRKRERGTSGRCGQSAAALCSAACCPLPLDRSTGLFAAEAGCFILGVPPQFASTSKENRR
jgi:hypothetical protein